MRRLTLVICALLALSPALAAKAYKVLHESNGTYYVFIDILADSNLISAVGKEAIYKKLINEICGSSACTVMFWLDEGYAPKKGVLTDANKERMIAHYRQENGSQKAIYHWKLAKIESDLEEATCIKEVFHKYCLGGSSNDLPPHDRQEITGDVDRRFFGSDVGVFSVRGKVAEIRRVYSDMSWLKFNSTEGKISDIYGSPDDLSYYPDYAKDESSRATAIRLGRAHAVKKWQQNGWTIRWAWLEDYGRLDYTHGTLSDALETVDEGEGF